MSEEILRAMMELFALIVKQDGGMLQSESCPTRVQTSSCTSSWKRPDPSGKRIINPSL
ncbi:MAG: hypothetical protein MUE37_10490 [Bacteroidales bacterium]|nr:hypothetical protein [Bacteroidales bacterium]